MPSSDGGSDPDDFGFPVERHTRSQVNEFASLKDLALWGAEQLDEEIQELSMLLGLKKKRRKEITRKFGI